MSTPEFFTAPNTESPSPDEREARNRGLRDKLAEFLVEKWGLVPPPCPYCRIAAWSVDPEPVTLQRTGALPGFGVPVFLVWCANCGNEVHVAVAVTGLWEEAMGYPMPSTSAPAPVADEGETEMGEPAS